MARRVPETFNELLAERDHTGEVAAVLAGCDPGTISRIRNGLLDGNPSVVLRLARAYGIKPTRMRKLLSREANRRPDAVAS